MSTISLCMIVKDEAAALPACLASAGRGVDEAVVVDTGSTDGTPDIARRHGARVISWPWRDDFAAARNQALRHARGEWALILDADERLAPGGPALVRATVESDTASGFDCRLVSTLPPGQPSATITARYCRLFRRRPGVAFVGRIHEQVAPSILRGGGSVVRSDIVIEHEGYARPSAEKLERNLRLLHLALEDEPGQAFALLNLGLTLQAMDRWDESLAALEGAIVSTVAPLPPSLRAVAWTHVAEGRARHGRWIEAGRGAQAALAEEPDLALARHVLARALFEQGDFDGAAEIFHHLLGARPDALGMTLHLLLPALGLGLCHLRRRRFGEAAAVLARVADSDPSGEAAFQLGNAFLGLRRTDRAAEAYRAAHLRGFVHRDLDRRLALCTRLAAAEPVSV
jgi:glycosyl transferase family 2/tetratricopeptide repeat protein